MVVTLARVIILESTTLDRNRAFRPILLVQYIIEVVPGSFYLESTSVDFYTSFVLNTIISGRVKQVYARAFGTSVVSTAINRKFPAQYTNSQSLAGKITDRSIPVNYKFSSIENLYGTICSGRGGDAFPVQIDYNAFAIGDFKRLLQINILLQGNCTAVSSSHGQFLCASVGIDVIAVINRVDGDIKGNIASQEFAEDIGSPVALHGYAGQSVFQGNLVT